LSAGEPKALEKLCDLFNGETCNGSDMAKYDELLEKAVQAIKQTFKRRNIGGLLSGRGGKLVAKARQITGVEDFELITWLVIKDGRG
jgi:hypothetical protein